MYDMLRKFQNFRGHRQRISLGHRAEILIELDMRRWHVGVHQSQHRANGLRLQIKLFSLLGTERRQQLLIGIQGRGHQGGVNPQQQRRVAVREITVEEALERLS